MKKETITRIKLTASEGHVLTNGESFGKIVYLASGNEGDGWYEITEAEYEKIKEAEEIENMPI